MSNLANSCEFLSVDKTCVVFDDNSKAKANRQLNCKNSQNIACCCYICVFRVQCAISCKYLGQYGFYSEPRHVTEDTYTVTEKDLKAETLQFESVPVAFCFSCNVEMAWVKTQFTVDNWKGNAFLLDNCKTLSVTVFLCPKCGKIEFKAVNPIIREEL